MGLARITAGIARQNDHGVAADPTPGDQSHAVLIPAVAGSRRKEAARRIAKAAKIVVKRFTAWLG